MDARRVGDEDEDDGHEEDNGRAGVRRTGLVKTPGPGKQRRQRGRVPPEGGRSEGEQRQECGVERHGIGGIGGIGDGGGGNDDRGGDGVGNIDADGDGMGNAGKRQGRSTWGSDGQWWKQKESPLRGRRPGGSAGPPWGKASAKGEVWSQAGKTGRQNLGSVKR